MDILFYLLWLAIIGLVVGALARLVVPGPDPMTLGMTILIGLAGAFLAGLIARAIWGDEAAPGLIGAVVVTALLVWATRSMRGPRGEVSRRR